MPQSSAIREVGWILYHYLFFSFYFLGKVERNTRKQEFLFPTRGKKVNYNDLSYKLLIILIALFLCFTFEWPENTWRILYPLSQTTNYFSQLWRNEPFLTLSLYCTSHYYIVGLTLSCASETELSKHGHVTMRHWYLGYKLRTHLLYLLHIFMLP